MAGTAAPAGRVPEQACARATPLAGDEFDQLVRDQQRRIHRVLLAMVRDPDLADTLTQECFLRAWQSRATFRGESSAATWLVRIAINLARDHSRNRRAAFWNWLRREPRAAGRGDGQADATDAAMMSAAHPGPSPERALAARQDAAAAWDAADALAPQQRTVFLLRFAEEMSLEEIAEATGLRAGTVKVHLHRAVHAVRQRLEKRGVR